MVKLKKKIGDFSDVPNCFLTLQSLWQWAVARADMQNVWKRVYIKVAVAVAVAVARADMHNVWKRVYIKVATRDINFGIVIKIPQKVELDLP